MKNRNMTAKSAEDEKSASRQPATGMQLRIAGVVALLVLAGCQPTENQIDQRMMTATTSPIPGAIAKVLPAPAGTQSHAPAANFCVTDAGYCPLAAAAAAGQNCICQAGSLMYGGKTNAAPTTFRAPLIGQ